MRRNLAWNRLPAMGGARLERATSLLLRREQLLRPTAACRSGSPVSDLPNAAASLCWGLSLPERFHVGRSSWQPVDTSPWFLPALVCAVSDVIGLRAACGVSTRVLRRDQTLDLMLDHIASGRMTGLGYDGRVVARLGSRVGV
jgi:hypothetical protein